MYKILKSAKICDWDVQIKMSLSPELMGDFRIYRKIILPVNQFAIQARGSKRQNVAERQKNMA